MAINRTSPNPWDDPTMPDRLMTLVQDLPRVRLDRLDAPSVPAVYLQFAATDHEDVAEILGPVHSSGRYPIYVGSAARSGRERLRRYHQSLRGVRALRVQDLHIALLPCSSTAAARYCEAALLEHLDPVMNRLGGWGAKVPGGRRNPRVSPVDAVWPGRRWAPPAPLTNQMEARLTILEHLAAMDPAGPRWPPINERASGPDPGPALRAVGRRPRRAS